MLTIPRKPYAVNHLFYSVLPGPWGMIGLAATDKGLAHIQSAVADEESYVSFLKQSFTARPEKNVRRLQPVSNQIRLYLKGQLKTFDIPLDLITGTLFQKKVWKQLSSIPYGETRSYSWLARAVKRPGAYRAAGNANGKNPLPILLPCHRIIHNDGGLGGYSGGLHIKKYLLELERTGHAPV